MKGKHPPLDFPTYRIYLAASNDCTDLQHKTNAYFAEMKDFEITEIKYEVKEINGQPLYSLLIAYKYLNSK